MSTPIYDAILNLMNLELIQTGSCRKQLDLPTHEFKALEHELNLVNLIMSYGVTDIVLNHLGGSLKVLPGGSSAPSIFTELAAWKSGNAAGVQAIKINNGNHPGGCTCFQCAVAQPPAQQPQVSQTNVPNQCGTCGQVVYPLSAHACPPGPVVTQNYGPYYVRATSSIGKGLGPITGTTYAEIARLEALAVENQKSFGVSELLKKHKCTCDLRGSNCWNGCTCGGE